MKTLIRSGAFAFFVSFSLSAKEPRTVELYHQHGRWMVRLKLFWLSMKT